MSGACKLAFDCQYPVVNWLSDETFFSLCSRQHIFSGNVLPGRTSAQMFGLPVQRIKHDLPCGLDAFEQKTCGYWGSADSILAHHTIFPFFAPFQSEAAISSAVMTLKGSDVGSLKYRFGLVSGGFGAEHPLKGCTECVKHDVAFFGAPYWHLSHQYPGMLLCPVHRILLRECTRNRRWCDRFSWTVPSDDILSPPSRLHLEHPEQVRLSTLASAVLDLASIGLDAKFDPVIVSKVYRQQLSKVGHAHSLLKDVTSLRRFHPFEGLPATEEASASFIDQLTRCPRRHYHPLKHLVMITWLFEDLHSFRECYQCMAALVRDSVPQVNLGISANTETVRCAAPISDINYRPKKLKPPVRSALVERLATGAPKQLVCSEFQLTISTVNKLLRAEPQIQAMWVQAQKNQALDRYRGHWNELRQRFPNWCVKSLREYSPSTYAWLYRNDSAWLRSQGAQTPKPRRVNRASVDWAARDNRLQGEVRERLFATYGTDRDLRLSKSQLYSLVPELPSCLENSQRYPYTRLYLATVLSKPSGEAGVTHT